jgi:hypothetical protein
VKAMNRTHIGVSLLIASGLVVFPAPRAAGQDKPLPHGVEKICAISFDQDSKRPARVEDAALDCLNAVSQRLKASPSQKVVLVGTADPIKDHAEEKRGQERMKEDDSGEDVRFGDVAMYRAVNTKDYLVRWNHAAPGMIIPTSDEWASSQQVMFYLVPADANFTNNYLGTTKTNEKICTVKPCPDPREERLTPQPRNRIIEK